MNMAEATTAERSISQAREEVIKEAQRIEEGTAFTAKEHFTAAEVWRAAHFTLGLITVVLATLAGAKAFSKFDADGTIAGWLSIIVAVLSAVTTFLNPNKRATEHLSAGNKYDALTSKARIFRTIDCWGDGSDNSLASKLKTYSEERSTLNKASPPLFWLAYRIAKRNIERGQTTFAVDGKAAIEPQTVAIPAKPLDESSKTK
jgi:hypothetical protein